MNVWQGAVRGKPAPSIPARQTNDGGGWAIVAAHACCTLCLLTTWASRLPLRLVLSLCCKGRSADVGRGGDESSGARAST